MTTTRAEKWYAVTYRAPAEMTVWVLAETPDDARMRAEEGFYEESSQIEFLKNKPYTMKVSRDRVYPHTYDKDV